LPAELEFQYPSHILYAALAVAAVFFFLLGCRKKERMMAAFRLAYAVRLKALRAALLAAGLGLMAFSLLGPRVFGGYAEARKTGLDIYVLVDTSKSMLVSDIEPNRITVAKKIAGELLDSLEGDRVGLIPFASDAYVQMPLTDDYQLARMFLDVMDTDMMSGGGTNLAAAMRLADRSFDRASSGDRVILILSDGEEHEGDSLGVPGSIADGQTRIYTVGVGTERGGLVPVLSGAGDAVAGYMTGPDQNPVTSRLNAGMLRELASRGGGAYFQASLQGAETSALLEELSALKRGELEAVRARRYEPLYQYFLGPGLLAFLIAWFLPERGRAA